MENMDQEGRTPQGEPPHYDGNPEQSPVPEVVETSTAGLKISLVLVLFLAGFAAVYGWLQHDAARQLALEQTGLRTSLAQTKDQEQVLTSKINAMSAAEAKEEAARAQQEDAARNAQFLPRTHEARRRVSQSAEARRRPEEDPRWKQFQNQLGDQQKELAANQKQIAETRANLDQARADMENGLLSARTELGGDIARNHAQVVALEKKGERNFYEFSFEKGKTFHHAGPISIALRKANSKHQFCDLEMQVDDREITRKHVDLYESLSLYPDGYPMPLEVVINRIDKDSVRGYVSVPKFQARAQAVVPASPASPAAVTVTPAAPAVAAADVTLEHRN